MSTLNLLSNLSGIDNNPKIDAIPLWFQILSWENIGLYLSFTSLAMSFCQEVAHLLFNRLPGPFFNEAAVSPARKYCTLALYLDGRLHGCEVVPNKMIKLLEFRFCPGSSSLSVCKYSSSKCFKLDSFLWLSGRCRKLLVVALTGMLSCPTVDVWQQFETVQRLS